MAEAENCRGECGGGLLVDITGGRKTNSQREDEAGERSVHACHFTHHCVRRRLCLGDGAAGKC